MDVRVALVTGAASGIGRAAAALFASGGATVVAADLDEAGAGDTAAGIVAAGGRATAVRVDVADEDSVAAMVEQTRARHGRIDAAFNNAGISDVPRSWIGFPTEAFDRMLAVDLRSVFLCLKHELACMAAQEPRNGLRGQIVNTASGAGLIAAPGQPHYTAAKHGVIGLTRSAAQEFGKQRICVNTLCPGITDTKMARESCPPEMLRGLAAMSPTGELGRPEDVARVAVWLCSPEAHWVNGQAIVADGGGVMH